MNDKAHDAASQDSLTRRNFLKRSSSASIMPIVSTEAAARDAESPRHDRPNVILIISDQFRWDCLGSNGLNPLNLTPNLDRMAAEGVNFANAITNQPVCAPSRACLFTSSYTNRHGVWRNGIALPRTHSRLRRFSDKRATRQLHRQMAPRAYRTIPRQSRPNIAAALLIFGRAAMHWKSRRTLMKEPFGTARGQPIQFKDQYRVISSPSRAIRFLRQESDEAVLASHLVSRTAFSERLQLLRCAKRLCGPLSEFVCTRRSEILSRGLAITAPRLLRLHRANR